MTMKMTTVKDFEKSINTNINSPSEDSTKLDDPHPETCNNTRVFIPFTLSVKPHKSLILIVFEYEHHILNSR